MGNSIDVSGNLGIVGAYTDEYGGIRNSGSAYLFDVSSGIQKFKLGASDASVGDTFGISVGISGTSAIVGARFDDAPDLDSGSAYLFDASIGQQRFKLRGSDTLSNDEFGYSVGISGNVAIVGAPGNDAKGSNAGAAYLFDVATGQQTFVLHGSDTSIADQFGHSVAIDGNRALVGAVCDGTTSSNCSGLVYLFDVTTGKQLLKFKAGDPAVVPHFGAPLRSRGTLRRERQRRR